MINIKKTMAALTLAAITSICALGKTQASTLEEKSEARIGFAVESPIVKRVSNIPVEQRDVPIHSGDSGSQAPIASDYVDVGVYGYIPMRVGITTGKENPVYATFGYGIDLDIVDLLTGTQYSKSRNMVERNYKGNPGPDDRGVGTALTYMSVYPAYYAEWNSFMRPFLFTSVTMQNDDSALVVGADIFNESYYNETGWDRYNYLDEKGSQKLAEFTVVRPNVSLQRKAFSGRIGLDFSTSLIVGESLTQTGKEMNIEKNSFPWAAGLSYTRKL